MKPISSTPRAAAVSTKRSAASTVGAIPSQGAALNRSYLSVAELTVEAARSGSRELVKQALLADPNASSTLTPDVLWDLVDAMFDAHAELMPASLGGAAELWLP